MVEILKDAAFQRGVFALHKLLCKYELSMKKIFFLLLIIGAGWKFYKQSGQVSLGPGVLASEAPHQESIGSSVSRRIDDYTITVLAKFRIKAKVLSKENYYLDRGADLSPTDLALGWGNMSDEVILDKIEISQSGRFYRWHVKSFPISRREIETHSANMHLIPVSDAVKSDIDRVRKGEIIEMSGSLVAVISHRDGWHWKSSQTRNDTGAGACELILVDSLHIIAP
ncbi:MAG: hypothetical protein ACI965_001268 [Paraglaciecola sp.]|jgi:hypothetical protein